MSEQKWVRSSLRHLAQRLEDLGHPASPPTVGRLLRKLGYSLRVNMQQLNLEQHSVCSQWNYTIRPRLAALSAAPPGSEGQEVIFLYEILLAALERTT